MTRSDPRKQIRALISRFDEAAQAYAFKGAAHPEDQDEIERAYIVTRRALEDGIGKAIGLSFREPNKTTMKALRS
jgi:hypothetical protein